MKFFKRNKNKTNSTPTIYDADLIIWEVEWATNKVLDFIPPKDFLIFDPHLENIINKINRDHERRGIPAIAHPGVSLTMQDIAHLIEASYDYVGRALKPVYMISGSYMPNWATSPKVHTVLTIPTWSTNTIPSNADTAAKKFTDFLKS